MIKNFLNSRRRQRVVLNGQYLSFSSNSVGVPHGSLLGSLFFLGFINELSNDLLANPKLIYRYNFLSINYTVIIYEVQIALLFFQLSTT